MTSRFIDHLLEGDHASRPAFGDVPEGTLYACSTHGLIYQSDGSSAWSTWATLGGSVAAGDVAFTPAGTIAATDVQAAIEEVASEAGGSGGWEQVVDEDGTSFTNWSGTSGTWSSDGTIIKNTDTADSVHYARLTTPKITNGGFVYQAEIRLPSSGQGATPNFAGLVIGASAAMASPAGFVLVKDTTSRIDGYRFGGGTIVQVNLGTTLAADTWYTLRLVTFGVTTSFFLGGTLIGTASRSGIDTDFGSIGLFSQRCISHYRNIKAWTLTLPA